ncbi:MAG: type III pantothenate kinase, partial [Rhodobacteraceae bacterium]|nr:type III pantothenate kinase [Paracoccaceae bacterium]
MTGLLAIDVGNTNTVFALYDGERLTQQWRCATNPLRTGDEYYAWLSSLAGTDTELGAIRAMVIASVVPETIMQLESLARHHLGTRPLVVGRPDCVLPVAVRVDPATRVGADRLVNTVAAYARYGGDLIVVDFGTATTFDVVDSDG